MWGLRRLRRTDRPALVLCDVSPPRSDQEILEAVDAIRSEAHDRWRLAIMGVQPVEELERLARASKTWVVSRGADPFVMLRDVECLISGRSGDLAPSAVKLLLVDDSEVTLQLMQERLCDAGFDVRIAVALGEAPSILRGWSPNVIIADVNMAEMRDDDLCARLKARIPAEVLVVLCSSIPEEELAPLARAAGADGFVSKSQGLDVLVRRIAETCRTLSEPVVSIH
jgi:CheY-like chemotaxis protein